MSNQVYICSFPMDRVNQYLIEPSIQNEYFDYFRNRDILMLKKSTNDIELRKVKEKYKFLSLELTDANHFFRQSKIVPDGLWVENINVQLPTETDYIFSIWNGGILFNQKCADILKQFRMGENILTPVQINDLSSDGLASDETFHFLNLYERRMYICEAQTTARLKQIPNAEYGIRISRKIFNDAEINVDKSALDCNVDLWYDPRILGHFFMSENLHKALYHKYD